MRDKSGWEVPGTGGVDKFRVGRLTRRENTPPGEPPRPLRRCPVRGCGHWTTQPECPACRQPMPDLSGAG